MTSLISDDMKSRIAQCQKCCDDLKQKFITRLNVETNRHTAEIKGDSMYHVHNNVYSLRIDGDGCRCKYSKNSEDIRGQGSGYL